MRSSSTSPGVPVQVAVDRRVVGPGRLGAVVVRVAVHVDVAARRRPRLVRLEGVHHEAERALADRGVEHPRAVAEHARGERLRVVVGVTAIGEVAAHAIARVRVLDLGGQPVAQLTLRYAGGGAADLAAAPDEAVEAAPEGAPGRGEAKRGVVGHVRRPVARTAQGAREGRAHVRDRRPAGLGQQAAVGVPAAKREHPPSRQDRPARGDGGHGLGVEAREAEPLARERVDVGRAGALAEGVVGPQRIHDDHHDVGVIASLGARHLVQPGEHARRRPRGLEELAARAGRAHPPQIVIAGGGPGGSAAGAVLPLR